MTQQMQNLQLCQSKKHSAPSSPNAAKRLYRNLSEKLKGSHSSFDETYFRTRTDRLSLRKTSMNFQGNEAMFEAVEQQDMDAVQILLYQYTPEELDLNTPNSEGLTPLDIAIMTNNVPIARILLRTGARESPHFVSLESRAMHLNTLVQEAQERVNELSAQVQNEGFSLDNTEKEKQLKAWEWRYRLYRRMKTGFEHARAPEVPTNVYLMVTSSTSLTVSFQEPLSVNAAVVTRYKDWKDYDDREPRHKGQSEVLEGLLQQVRTLHQQCSCRESSKLQTTGRKQSVSRSLKHLFHSSNKFVKTLKRGLYIAVIFYYKDNMLVTNEDQIPIVEIDDCHTSSIIQDFLWFTKLSCMWEDIRWLRQSVPISMSSSTVLQTRQKMLAATAQLQNLLGTHNLGRVYYEPIKDRHGNILIVTIREVEMLYSFFNGKWMQISKLQSQRKSLSTPEEPTALDILLITIQDILSYHKRSHQRLSPGLYLGFLKLCSSVDQIKVLVTQKLPNILCHVKIRENSNISKEEWEWIQKLSGSESMESVDHTSDCPTQLFFYELQMAVKALLKQINIPLHQARNFRLYTQEVLEMGHNVSFLLLLPASDDVCTAPGQNNPYTPHSGFLNLPLQMFELVHFCSYREKFISLYCRLSAVVELDSLNTQQALREAISDSEVAAAKQRYQQVLDFIQKIDEVWREMRWITDALQYARYKQPVSGLPIMKLIDPSDEQNLKKISSTSSHIDCLPSPSPSPEMHRRKAVSDSQPCSDEEGCSEVFLPTDSDYDSSDALSPRDLDLVYLSSHDIAQQALSGLSGSAPDVLQVHDMKSPTGPGPDLQSRAPGPDSDHLCAEFLHSLTFTRFAPKNHAKMAPGARPPLGFPGKRKQGKHQHYGGFSRHHRWLRMHSETQSLSLSLSEGVYTQHLSRACGLEPGEAERLGPLPDGPRGLTLTHAASLPEERKSRVQDPSPSVRRIYVEPYPEALVGPDAKPWASLSPPPGGCSGLPSPTDPEMTLQDPTTSAVSEILSSML
ncbi:ankyrin repeat and fibronectin type-III domain-containing protein 1 isoform X2 [Choloepus didactylus]|uniref:ankyrin repeat and fibronectin type-III domain-containing protein 1 isoform X2 n=1 Tax=Choloepus didactylus TaxID=27675 RepID=UPI00189CCC41|nr:ankyrin repeat and fibronectin type-III domain-containing protein 1 isoform X2 [Choloepus didactylus]